MTTNISERYDFIYLFDVKDGNPNGDPDLANTPRFDPETFQGLVSDVCLKRKIRDYVYALKAAGSIPQDKSGYEIYVQPTQALEECQEKAYNGLNFKAGDKEERDKIKQARGWMCGNFFDVRTFGAVMSTKHCNCGQVRGPVQVTFARSFDRVFSTEHGITRVAYTTKLKREGTTANTEMGNKHTVAYGLYCAYGFINPPLAADTGFNQEDLDLLWKALINMFDMDHSASRGLMAARKLYVFKHASALGEAPAHKLFELVQVSRNPGVESPRQFSDYQITVNTDALPHGVTLTEKIDGQV